MNVSTNFATIQYGFCGNKCSWCGGKDTPGTTRNSNNGLIPRMTLCYFCEKMYKKAIAESQSVLNKARTKAIRNAQRRK